MLETSCSFTPKYFTMYFLRSSSFPYITTEQSSKSGNLTLLDYYHLIHRLYSNFLKCSMTNDLKHLFIYLLASTFSHPPGLLRYNWHILLFLLLNLTAYFHSQWPSIPAILNSLLVVTTLCHFFFFCHFSVCLMCPSPTSSLGETFMYFAT